MRGLLDIAIGVVACILLVIASAAISVALDFSRAYRFGRRKIGVRS